MSRVASDHLPIIADLMFGLTEIEGKKLISITAPAPVIAAIGTAKTAAAFGLPTKVTLVTDVRNVTGSVNWDLNSASYDPTATTAQTFTVTGEVTLPVAVNPNSVPLTTSISVSTKPAELVAHWKFDEGSGTTVGDSSGKGNIGTLVNNPTWTDSGKTGGALAFSGGSRVEINAPATLNQTGDETVSLWFKTSQPATSTTSIFRQDQRFTALQLDSGKAQVAYWPNASSGFKSLKFPWTYSDNNWHHYVASYDRSTGLKIYVDGNIVASDTTNLGPLPAVTNKIALGAAEYGGEAYNGLLDDVRVFDLALTQDQVRQLSDQQPPTTTDNAPSGWVNQDTTITLSASDNGTGVANTYYTVDGGAEQTGTSVVLSEEGVHKLVYWSVVKAGNVEAAQSLEVKIDLTSPVVKITGAPSYTIDQTVTMTCSATDVISSVYGTPCANPLLQAKAYTLLSGQNTVSVTAEDVAGHKTTATHTFTVKATFDSLKTVTTAFLQATNVNGWDSVAKSFNSKLDQAKAAAASGKIDAAKSMMDDYIGQVTDQSGKFITKEQADILLRWAKTII